MMIPDAFDTAGVADYVRQSVLRDMHEERRRRVEAFEPDLDVDDERRFAGSASNRALARLRADQAAQGMPLPESGADGQVRKRVLDAIFGLGPLQDLLDDPDIVEVNLIGCDQVWASYDNGEKRSMPAVMANDDDLIDWVRSQAMYGHNNSRAWDTSNPIVEFELNGGHRLVGIMGCSERPAISIRLFRRPTVTLTELQSLGSFDPLLADFLRAVVKCRMNVMLSGETGSGKTTLLRALAAEIPPNERIVTIEHFPELGLNRMPDRHPEVVALEERPANAEGQGGLSMTKLVRTSRRLGPDRLIVGECVGEEVVDMLDAMTQGNDGGFTTIHARSARKVPERIATYALRQGLTTDAALQLCATALDVVVHMAKVRLPGGGTQRCVTAVEEVLGYDGNHVAMNRLWALKPDGRIAEPEAAMSEGMAKRLAEVGFQSGQVLSLADRRLSGVL